MESSPTKEDIVEIKPLGTYYELDDKGYVLNPASAEKIQEEWKPVIELIVDAIKRQYGDKLKSIYIRGSVPRGLAVPYISDIDALAYVDLSREEVTGEWKQAVHDEIAQKYPFVEDAELHITPLSNVADDYIVLNQAVCVYGEQLEIPKMKPGKEMMNNLPKIHTRMENFEKRFPQAQNEEDIKGWCTWLMKDILRIGFELTMERSGRYTRDLYKCYEGFSEYYPEKESEMKQVLYYAINPTGDKEEIVKIKNAFVPWLVEEAKKYNYV